MRRCPVLCSNRLPLRNSVPPRTLTVKRKGNACKTRLFNVEFPPRDTLPQPLILNDCFTMCWTVLEQRCLGGALKMTERRSAGGTSFDTTPVSSRRRSVTRQRCPASVLTDEPTSGVDGLALQCCRSKYTGRLKRGARRLLTDTRRGTKRQFVDSRTFSCFARVNGEEHGKHGDGVQPGELEESTKEEKKSAD